MSELFRRAKNDLERLSSLRREFHRCPELALNEFKTADSIERELDLLGIGHSRVGATGVLGVLTAEDVPVNKVGHIQQDWDVFIAEGDTTRMTGDAICMVVAESMYILEEAKKAIEIEYEVLEPVRNIEEAIITP